MTIQLEGVARDFCNSRGLVFRSVAGEGTFKETYAIEMPNGDKLALKIHRPGFSPERTAREMDAMQRCSHANIGKVSSFETFTSGGTVYSISLEEFFAGGTLSDRLSGGKLISSSEIESLGRFLIDAIVHMASLRLVHRDLKPDNIMFRDGGMTPVVVDFGLVRDLAEQSLTMTWLMQGPGTPLFASPEQLRNEKSMIDWRSDQFALGVVLSFAAFGFHPYAEATDTWQQAINRVATRVGPTQRFVTATISSGLRSLSKMTAPFPIQRFRTPSQLAAGWPQGT